MSKTCLKCGKELNDNAKFCNGCGKKFEDLAYRFIDKPLSKKGIAIAIIVMAVITAVVAFIIQFATIHNEKKAEQEFKNKCEEYQDKIDEYNKQVDKLDGVWYADDDAKYSFEYDDFYTTSYGHGGWNLYHAYQEYEDNNGLGYDGPLVTSALLFKFGGVPDNSELFNSEYTYNPNSILGYTDPLYSDTEGYSVDMYEVPVNTYDSFKEFPTDCIFELYYQYGSDSFTLYIDEITDNSLIIRNEQGDLLKLHK